MFKAHVTLVGWKGKVFGENITFASNSAHQDGGCICEDICRELRFA